MTNTNFDQAQHSAWAEDFETEAEREEREAFQAGNVWEIISDSTYVELMDYTEEAYREFLLYQGDPWGRWLTNMEFVPPEVWDL